MLFGDQLWGYCNSLSKRLSKFTEDLNAGSDDGESEPSLSYKAGKDVRTLCCRVWWERMVKDDSWVSMLWAPCLVVFLTETGNPGTAPALWQLGTEEIVQLGTLNFETCRWWDQAGYMRLRETVCDIDINFRVIGVHVVTEAMCLAEIVRTGPWGHQSVKVASGFW